MEARNVKWEHLERITERDDVVTGESTEETEPGPAPTTPEERAKDPLRKRPLIVFVHDDPDLCDDDCKGACERYFEAENQIFSKEKILLAMHAFRPIRMTLEHAGAEPLLAGDGQSGNPRLVFLDVARGQRTTLKGSGLSASRVYAEMKKTASGFYKEKLDTVVKKHQKLLGEHDKLAQEELRVREQESKTEDDRRARKLQKELDEIEQQKQELDRKIEDLWALTLKGL